jgi:hypothetical protein
MSGSHGFRLALNILQIYIDKMNKPLKKRRNGESCANGGQVSTYDEYDYE